MQAVFSLLSRSARQGAQPAVWLAAALVAGAAQAQGFDFDSVTRLARERAEKPYRAASDKLPADLAKLNYDQVRDIRWRPDRALWRAEKLPFEAMFFHLGLYQKEPVLINEVTPQGARHISYSRADFDYGKNQVKPEAWGDLGFAGFRLHNHLNSNAYKDELVVFQGASYFRA
ncbi:MAG TPA: glucan biosynthesis protein, partial [Acidovorax sp.]|nr:glucan biosynthesis protein [Acidovorax sp.]